MNAGRGVVALAVALVLSACSEGEKPAGSLPQLTQSPSATPTATPSVPPFPATKQGAADFVRYYLRVGNTVESTGRVELLLPLFAPTCKTCNDYVRSMRKYWESGYIVGGQVNVLFVETALADAQTAAVTATVSSPGGRIYNSAGKLVDRIRAVRGGTLLFRLIRTGPGWRVSSYGVAS